MPAVTILPTAIEKEQISALRFPKGEVLESEETISSRNISLNMATKLGNNHRRKVKILFCDIEGIKQVETTIWATTDQSVMLKGGLRIPINRILEIKTY